MNALEKEDLMIAHAGTDNGLRREVRSLVAESGVSPSGMCDAWMRGHNLEFTKLLAENRLIGLTWPREFGGREASNLDRLVVTEELLRVGAPVAAHWIADRQIGPAILRHGSQEMQRQFLPRIAAGEVTFCLGMSESESGSDLAAVRTKAVRDGDNFRITGRKIWTSHAHRSTHAYVLARTGGGDVKHDGLTEFVVDLSSPGVEIRPIYDLAGEHHFNETIFDDVVVPVGNVIGEIGNGWKQVTEQLAFERGGMERVLSTYPLLEAAIGDGETTSGGIHQDVPALGTLVARLHTLRAIGHGIARAMDAGEAPIQRAALLKYLGTTFEGDVVDHVRDALAISPDPDAAGIEGLLARGILATPGATLRGGATEVLLTIVGRQELSTTAPHRRSGDSADLRTLIDDVLDTEEHETATGTLPHVWRTAVELGWTGIGVPESAGGSGGEIRDLAVIATSLAHRGLSAPIVDTALAGRILASTGRPVDGSRPTALALNRGIHLESREGRVVLNGCQTRVPWGRLATSVVVSASGPDGEVLVEVPIETRGVSVEHGTNLAGEPRDTLTFVDVTVDDIAVVGDGSAAEDARALNAVLQSAAIVGAVESATKFARDHALVREQFGKPLAAFQAVAHNIARMAGELVSAEVALEQGLAELETGGPGWRAIAARIITGRAASTVAKTAHQVLGAIGITQEHDLHIATLRLWAWRDDGVAERTLAYRLGDAAIVAGGDATWEWCVHETDKLSSSPWRNQ